MCVLVDAKKTQIDIQQDMNTEESCLIMYVRARKQQEKIDILQIWTLKNVDWLCMRVLVDTKEKHTDILQDVNIEESRLVKQYYISDGQKYVALFNTAGA